MRFNKTNIYISTSIFIGVLIIAILAWAVFLSDKQSKMQKSRSGLDSSGLGGIGTYNRSMFGKKDETADKEPKSNEEKAPEKITLSQLHNMPVVDSTIVNINDTEFLLFTERETGHAFKIEIATKSKTERILHTTAPAIQETVWTGGGSGLIRRYLNEDDDIISVYNKIPKKEDDYGDGTAAGVFLRKNILSITNNPKEDQIFYIIDSGNGVNGYISNVDGTEKELFWQSKTHEWLVNWQNAEQIIIKQKSGFNLGSVVYSLNTKTKELATLLHSLPGLTVLLPDNMKNILYGTAGDNGIELHNKNIESGKITDLVLSSFAEKCVWDKKNTDTVYCFVPKIMTKGQYPDLWYQGLAKFNDALWKINTKTGSSEEILFPERDYNVIIDAENLSINKTGQFLFFKNKPDQTLWLVSIPKKTREEEINEENEENT